MVSPKKDPIFRLVNKTDNLALIRTSDSESDRLRDFLINSALSYQDHALALTYGFFRMVEGKETIIAFMTLVAAGIDTGRGVTLLPQPHTEGGGGYDPAQEPVYPYSVYPAIKIARLLVGDGHRGQKLGSALVDQAALIVINSVMRYVGCRFITVDSKKDAIGFYERCGFKKLDTKNNSKRDHPIMFIDLLAALRKHEALQPKAQPKGVGGAVPLRGR